MTDSPNHKFNSSNNSNLNINSKKEEKEPKYVISNLNGVGTADDDDAADNKTWIQCFTIMIVVLTMNPDVGNTVIDDDYTYHLGDGQRKKFGVDHNLPSYKIRVMLQPAT